MKTINKHFSQKGFTLIELMVASLLLVMLATVSVTLFFRSFRSTKSTEINLSLEQEAQYALSVMTRMIRNSVKITGLTGGGLCGDGSAAGDGITIVNFDGRSTTFQLLNGGIASNSAKISGNNLTVNDLDVQCIRNQGIPDTIRITIDAQIIDSEGNVQTRDFTSTVNLRNF